MKILKAILFLFKSRGIKRWIARLKTIHNRFGIRADKQMKIIDDFRLFLKERGLRANFFIPAVILKRHIKHFKKIDDGTIEWGIHGFVHNDHSVLSKEEQEENLLKAIETFDKYKIRFTGFRCPYLKFNEHTHKVLEGSSRFMFDSSESVYCEDIYNDSNKSYVWMNEFYKPSKYQQGRIGFLDRGMKSLPVFLPDDDILIDREKRPENEVYCYWNKILTCCHENNDLFVLQLHPERFLELKAVLERLVEDAKELKPPVLITTLGVVAKKFENNPEGHRGVLCITGDIDAVTILDFFKRLLDW